MDKDSCSDVINKKLLLCSALLLVVEFALAQPIPDYSYYGSAGSGYTDQATRVNCGENFNATNSSQILISPGWPTSYNNSMHCVWNITADPGYQVEFTFHAFDLEDGYDFLYIKLGLGRIPLTGSSLPRRPFYSINGSMCLTFTSDHSVQRTGFDATFLQVTHIQLFGPRGPSIGTYGFYANATNTSYLIQSPNFPFTYPNNLDVEWIIVAETPGFQVNFTLLQFDSEQNYDYMIVLDGTSSFDRLEGQPNIFPTYYSSSGYLRIWFRSDFSVRRRGFQALYAEVESRPANAISARKLINSTANITTPSIPRIYCKNGASFPVADFCNGTHQCSGYTENESIMCTVSPQNRSCRVHRDYVCNGTVICNNIRDLCEVGCANSYRCNNKTCVDISTLCDGNQCNGCEEDDEWINGTGFSCVRNGRKCHLPQQLLMDGVQDCDRNEDICFSSSLKYYGRLNQYNHSNAIFNRILCFQCLDGSMIIPRNKVCDDVIDCPDLSDECLCEAKSPKICDNIIIRAAATNERYNNSCAIGQLSCDSNRNSRCLNRTAVCNSIPECSDNFDEQYTFCRGTLQCRYALQQNKGEPCRCHETSKESCRETRHELSAILCNGIGECTTQNKPYFPSDECIADCPSSGNFTCKNITRRPSIVERINIVRRPVPAVCSIELDLPAGLPITYPPPTIAQKISPDKVCNGYVDCTFANTDELNCPDRYFCPTDTGQVSIPKSKVCNGANDCTDNSDEKDCHDRFYCSALGGTRISIPRSLVCDLNINCDNSEDEKNCSADGRFYCEKGAVLFVPKSKFKDGHVDCSDSSDECPSNIALREQNVFSSRYQLIDNPLFNTIVWIMGFLSVFGNSAVIYGEGKTLRASLRENTSAILRTNRMLILNLAVADLLMGFYLIILGSAAGYYSGVFCANRLEWLTSTTCDAMGVLVVLSSEVSVMTMVLLTAARLFAIVKPFTSSNKPTSMQVLLSLIAAWILAFFFAALPLIGGLQYIFAREALLNDNPFFPNVVVKFDSAQIWAKKLVTFDPQFSYLPDSVFAEIENAKSWYDLQAIIEKSSEVADYFTPTKFLGYYSANSVCISRLYVSKQDVVWPYSITLTVFNFCSFVFVATTYSFIIYKSRNPKIKQAVKHNRRQSVVVTDIQKKILRLVATDFCCWFPITIMAFLSIGGVYIPPAAYAASAIILLPINSALNPILYSDILDKLAAKIKNKEIFSKVFSGTTHSVDMVTETRL